MTYEEQVRRWKAAMDKTIEEARSTKDGGRKLLIKAGILTSDGKRLAKPYR